MIYYVYCITREDKKLYIGKTNNIKRRMCQHFKSKRFKSFNFTYDILFYSEDHDLIEDVEEFFIKYYDTYNNGLNLTCDGKGNIYTNKFTTLGTKWSDKTRKKILKNRKYISGPNNPNYGKKHTQELKIKWSKERKNKVFSKKFLEHDIENLLILYNSKPKIELENTIQKNGRLIKYDYAFCKKYHIKFKMSIPNMMKIIKGKTLAWKHIYEKIIDMKY